MFLTYMSGDVVGLVPIKCIEGLLVLSKTLQILQLFPAVFFLSCIIVPHYILDPSYDNVLTCLIKAN